MKVICMSDSHLRHSERFCNGIPNRIKFPAIPDGDILIHSGDFCVMGDVEETKIAMEWFGSLPHKHKVMIAGNHDRLFERNPVLARSMVPKDVIYLEDSLATIEGIRIYGSPWTPKFMDWSFTKERGSMWEIWSKMPDNIDILVTHGPPSGNLGGFLKNEQIDVGDEELLERILQVKPRFHVCGHVHEGTGYHERYGIHFFNAAICNYAYWPVNQPMMFNIGKRP